jgi:hypothetical protein
MHPQIPLGVFESVNLLEHIQTATGPIGGLQHRQEPMAANVFVVADESHGAFSGSLPVNVVTEVVHYCPMCP